MNNKFKTFSIFLITFFVLFIGLTLLPALKPTNDTMPVLLPTQPSNTPTPTLVTSSSPIFFQSNPTISPFVGDSLSIKKSLIEKTPYQTTNFLIEYLYTSDKFIVTIKIPPLEGNTKKAEQWFYDQGVKQLQDLNISYTSYF